MAAKKIREYGASFNGSKRTGWFAYLYDDGTVGNTPEVPAESFRNMIDILRNESPVWGDHSLPDLSTSSEMVGEGES